MAATKKTVKGWTWLHASAALGEEEQDEPADCYVCGRPTPDRRWWLCTQNGETVCDHHDLPVFDPGYW